MRGPCGCNPSGREFGMDIMKELTRIEAECCSSRRWDRALHRGAGSKPRGMST